MLPFRRHRTTVSPHEIVVFYPSYAYQKEPGFWSVVVQGCVFHQNVTWLRRLPVMSLIRRAMRVGRDGDVYFRQRMHQFLVHFSPGRLISVRMGNQSAVFGPSELAGLFRGELNIPLSETPLQEQEGPPEPTAVRSPPWVSFVAALPEGDARVFGGEAQLLEPHGVSIISDVDDTLKHSNVPDRRDLFRNTFVRDFVPIPGMPDLYRECEKLGAAFHYVSGSPWQLYEPLSEFWHSQGYPRGSFHLKRFRLRESARKLHRMSPQSAHKKTAIEPILAAFPQRRFVLIGDSGEQDPEIYAHFLRTYPEQVIQVMIRTVRGMEIDLPRLQQTFAGLPASSWTAYASAEHMRSRLLEQFANQPPRDVKIS